MESIECIYHDTRKTRVFIKTWLLDGKIHRTDGPAEIWYSETGEVIREEWYINGNNHRVDGPASISYINSGVAVYEGWFVNGIKHRTDGPAEINYYDSGKIMYELWFLHGGYHRIDGPEYIRYDESGNILLVEYRVNTRYCRKKTLDIITRLVGNVIWSRRFRLMKKTEKLVGWYYGPNGLGGRRDRRNLTEFVTGL